jgi:hypothetical protein
MPKHLSGMTAIREVMVILALDCIDRSGRVPARVPIRMLEKRLELGQDAP